VIDSCLCATESSLRLLACRGRTASLLGQAEICGVSLATLIPQASRTSALISAKTLVYRFDTGQNHKLSLLVRKLGFAKLLTKAKA
jgi:hypothetical protein